MEYVRSLSLPAHCVPSRLILGHLGTGCCIDPAAATAQEALGIQSGKEREKSVESTADVTVIKDTQVFDNKTGEVLSKKTESTPVTIRKENQIKTNVNVKVGDTQSTVK